MPDIDPAPSTNLTTTESLTQAPTWTGKKYSVNGFEKPVATTSFTYMFPELANDKQSLVPQFAETLQYLSELGAAMRDEENDPKFNSTIPAAYTYFGQFVNHDTAFLHIKKAHGLSNSELLADPNLKPWSDEMIYERVRNRRVKPLELDSVYGRMEDGMFPLRDPKNPDKLALGKVSKSGDMPPGKDDDNDLVRCPMSADRKQDRRALIADPRNDSNLILSQLQVAFLRAHNAIVDKKTCSYEDARKTLQKHYHWLILHDYLPKFVSDETIQKAQSEPLYNPKDGLPLEFSMGAFRFGHSMIRRSYYVNDSLRELSLAHLFTLLVLCFASKPTFGKGYDSLPEWAIIQWEKFLDPSDPNINAARKLRTQMVEPLFEVLDQSSLIVNGERRLAVQDLKRAYMTRIPTGQAIASQLGINPLTAQEIKTCTTPRQFEVLQNAGFLNHTPLTFYVLAEAANAKDEKLGPVGGRIMAEVLIGLMRNVPDPIIGSAWKPDLGFIPGTFFLPDLLRLAKVL
jgi:hypothetical protein